MTVACLLKVVFCSCPDGTLSCSGVNLSCPGPNPSLGPGPIPGTSPRDTIWLGSVSVIGPGPWAGPGLMPGPSSGPGLRLGPWPSLGPGPWGLVFLRKNSWAFRSLSWWAALSLEENNLQGLDSKQISLLCGFLQLLQLWHLENVLHTEHLPHLLFSLLASPPPTLAVFTLANSFGPRL